MSDTVAHEPVELHIVSDATGETAARLVLALEAQFPDQAFVEIRHPRVENAEDLLIAVQQARGRPAVMVYTLVEPGLRDTMRQLCRRARVHYCDLLGHPIDSISRVAGVAAKMEPGVRAPLDAQYFKRIEAIEFAVKYDDGVGRGLDEADVVLVGVSRTSKTPLSIYLGYLGHKAANVPVVKGIELPPELFELDPAKDFPTVESLGNVGSVSLPLSFALALERGFVEPGQRVALLGIGSGLQCAMLGVEW